MSKAILSMSAQLDSEKEMSNRIVNNLHNTFLDHSHVPIFEQQKEKILQL